MSDGTDATQRTLLLGLDGACLSVLKPMFDDGDLPVLEDVFTRGAVAPLESQIPPWTPSAWPSLYTGVNPGKHGVFDFLRFDGYDWDLVDRTDVDEWALWELLSRRDMTSVVVNVPVTAPPQEFDGALVPGYIAPETPQCHPPGLLEELREELGDYQVYAPERKSDRERRHWYQRLTRMRGRAFRYLVRQFDPEFGFLQFQQTDTVFHEQPDTEAVRDVYTAVDRELERVLDVFDPDTVIVASDHGMGEYGGWEFRINDYLQRQGYVTSTRGGEGMPSWSALRRRATDGDDAPSLFERASIRMARYGVTSQSIKRVLDRFGLTSAVLSVVPADVVRAATERVDFAASTAFMRSRTELGVRLNLAGREPDGTVSPAAYEAVRDEVIAALESARTPDGEPVFETVAPREEYFHGPHVEDAVDVVTVPANFDHYLQSSLRGEVFGPPSERWNHKRDGVIALAGAGIDPTADLADAHLFDVAPTVLATLGVPPSERMDGEVLPAVAAIPPVKYSPFNSPGRADFQAGEQVEQRLANLGYLNTDNDD